MSHCPPEPSWRFFVAALIGELLATAACAQSSERIGGSWEIRVRSTGMIESGNTITSLHRVTPLGTKKIDDALLLWRYYEDDCVVYHPAEARGVYAVCGVRRPVFVATGSQKFGPEGILSEGDVFVRDGIPWRKREVVPIEEIKKLAMAAGPYRPGWRSEVDRSKPVPSTFPEKKLGLNERDENGQTPLMLLVSQGDTTEVKALIGAGADVNVLDNYGYSPLMLAADDGQEETARLLIKAGADLNIQPNPGDTPLSRAVLKSHTGTALMLIAAGADVNLRMSGDDTPLSLAKQLKLESVVTALERAGAKE